MSVANSLAMKIAGVDRNTPDVIGGTIVKDPISGGAYHTSLSPLLPSLLR
jgi:predicted amidohydrolase YtcJ